MKRKTKITQPVSIVMIAYNESKNIVKVLTDYCDDIYLLLPPRSEFIIYLDKPSDKTPQIVNRISKKIKIKVISGDKNLGYAKAMKIALLRAKNDIVFYSDSSGKHSAKDFWKLLPHIKKFDIVTGCRSNRSDPFVRRVITVLQQLLVVTLFRVPFYDYNTGFKIVKKKILIDVLPECRHAKQSFSTELCVRALHKKASIANIPVSFNKREQKNQGTNFKSLPGIIKNNLMALLKIHKDLR